jgi:chemotaxis protein methyltransferase CheR
MKKDDCVAFLQWALPRLGYRWAGFRKVRGQVCKRIRRRMLRLGMADLEAYRAHLEKDAHEWTVLDGYCCITISRFYRDRHVFRTIHEVVMPAIADAAARDRRDARCWSAGCASGEEVYTLRLLWDLELSDRYRGVDFVVLGTDLEEAVLARAHAGCYEAGSLRELPPALIEQCFEQRDGLFCVEARYRHGISFGQQDIRRDMPPGPFDLILCRNLVLTYFAPALQVRVMRDMAVIGAHEALPDEVAGFVPVRACPQILRRLG